MGRKSARTPRLSRREKLKAEILTRASEAPRTEHTPAPASIPMLEPKNANQRTAIRLLQDGVPVVFLTGSAGTGKSMLAAWRASILLKTKRAEKVFLVRPAVSVGKSIGLLPGEIKDKLAPYFAQTVSHLEKFLGKGFLNYCLEKETIEMKPVEYLRGMSFENCVVIAEEVQNFTSEEMEMMLTRLGENCTIIFTGDTKQHDLKGTSGLEQTLNLLSRVLQGHPSYMAPEDMDELDDGIGVVRFTPEDVVRSGLTRAFVKLYFHNS